jgi:hypothetical protein
MFDTAFVQRRGGPAVVGYLVGVGALVAAAVCSALTRHYFLSAFAIGVVAALFPRARVLILTACVVLGLGMGLTPKRPGFENLVDAFNAAVVFSGLVTAGVVCVSQSNARRTGVWLLVGLLLTAGSCTGTCAARQSGHGQMRNL